MRKMGRLAAICIPAAFPFAEALAQSYPVKPVRVVVPTAPGGGLDMLSRLVAQKLSESLGQQFVIDNRPGAGANLGTAFAAKSAPDGYTLLVVPSSISISATLYQNLQYDALLDLAPITLIASTPSVLVVHPSVPAGSVMELIKLAKARPGSLTYASAGSGANSHLGVEMLKAMASIDLVHIPHKGIGPALTDVVAGHVSLMITGLPPALPQINAGKLRVIAMADAARSSLMPKVPTIAESGFPGYAVENWFGAFAPTGTPPKIIARLNSEVVRMLKNVQLREHLARLGYEPVGSTANEFAAQLKSEIAKWKKIIQETGARAD